jgi:hypothetical protein
VNGRRVEVATAGSGGAATVVFEAGLGEDWTDWDDVASEVSRHTRVFAYSRPGYGVSDPTPTPRNPRTIVEELRGLLAYEGCEREVRADWPHGAAIPQVGYACRVKECCEPNAARRLTSRLPFYVAGVVLLVVGILELLR